MSLIKSTLKNISLVYLSSGFTKILGLISTIILARLLTPSDFGIVGLASSIIGLIAVFGNTQIGLALIQRKDRIKEASDTVFIIDILIGLILFIMAFILAPFMSKFYNEQEIYLVIIVLSLGFILDSFGSAPLALLNRALQFNKIVFIEIIIGIISLFVTIGSALLGYSYWSLVFGTMVGGVINSILGWHFCSWRPRFRFNKELAKDMFKFGFYLFFSSIIVFFILSIDTFIVGKMFGLTVLGYYAMAFKFGNYSNTLITQVIGKVLFPTFSLIQNDLERLRKAYLMTLKYVSLLSIPIAFGTFILAKEFILLIIGEKWEPTIVLLQILCFYGLFRSLGAGGGNVFIALGKPQLSTKVLLVQLLSASLLIYPLVIKYGVFGIGLAMTISFIIHILILYIYIQRLIDISFFDQLNLIKIPLASSILMTLALYTLKGVLEINYLNLSFLLFLGVFIYFIGIVVFSKGKILAELKELLKSIKISKL